MVPITEINFFHIKTYQGNKTILVKPETDLIEPVPIGVYPNAVIQKISRGTAGKSKKTVTIYKGTHDLTELLKAEPKENNCLVSSYNKNSACVIKEKKKDILFMMLK